MSNLNGISMENPKPVWPSPVTPIPPQKRIKLASMVDCRLEMIRLYKDMRNQRLDVGDGSRLVHVLSQIQRSFIDTSLEDRIAALEQGAE
jgi:hypothetical protein